jgi:sarcosine/dimethylglycine N-methyltransferase
MLDLACGVGTTSFFIQDKYGCRVTGIDIDENLINIAKKPQDKKKKKDNISFKVADALKLPFPDNTFDTVIAQALLILIDDNEKALEEISRVLKPGGCFGSLELSWFTTPF